MPEALELQHLVSSDVQLSRGSQAKHSSCPYLGLLLATISSLFFSLCSVIVKALVEVIIIRNLKAKPDAAFISPG